MRIESNRIDCIAIAVSKRSRLAAWLFLWCIKNWAKIDWNPALAKKNGNFKSIFYELFAQCTNVHCNWFMSSDFGFLHPDSRWPNGKCNWPLWIQLLLLLLFFCIVIRRMIQNVFINLLFIIIQYRPEFERFAGHTETTQQCKRRAHWNQ